MFGVYPIFLHSRGLSQFEINSVLAMYFIVLFLTDVPTGAFADALGRRRSYVLGAAMRVIAFITYFFAHHYWVFLIAESIDGIGTTFGNGAIDAWGVDALDDAGYAGVKDRLFSRISQFNTAGFMVSALIGTFIADYDIAYPWLLGAAGYVVAGIAGARLMHDEPKRAARIEWTKIPRQIANRVGGGIRSGVADRTVLVLALGAAVTVASWAPYWLEWPLVFNADFPAGVWIIGFIYCGLSIARMIGAEVMARTYMEENSRCAVVAAFAGASGLALAIAGAAAGVPMASLAILFVMNLFTGALQPLTQSWLNEKIDSENRATLLSFNSTFATLGGSMGLLINGRIADRAGIPVAWQVSGLISLCAVPIYLSLRARAGTPAAEISGAD
jgi:MFS family permease